MSIIEKLKDSQLKKYLKGYGIKHLSVFGSYARGDNTKDSDLDLLINLDKDSNLSLFLLQDIEDTLTKKLDVEQIDFVTDKSLNSRLKKYIQEDLIKVF